VQKLLNNGFRARAGREKIEKPFRRQQPQYQLIAHEWPDRGTPYATAIGKDGHDACPAMKIETLLSNERAN
jgi:hypothetical protein